MPADKIDTIVRLAKARGIVFPSSEIYGGSRAAYDYGPLGVELKNNLKRLWWKHNVYERDDIEGVETAILMNPSATCAATPTIFGLSADR